MFITGIKSNLTILSVVNKTNMKKRLNVRKNVNKYDKFNYSFYNKVQKGFLKISRNNKNYIILDSNKNNIKENTEIIIEKLKKIISK